MANRKKFKSCPHCGEEKDIAAIHMPNLERWYVICRRCGAQTNLYSEEQQAINAWNLRAPMKNINNWMRLQANMVTDLSNQLDQADVWLGEVFDAFEAIEGTDDIAELEAQRDVLYKIKAEWLKGEGNNNAENG